MKILHVSNKPFNIETLEHILFKCLPGNYKIVWHTSSGIWDIHLHWNGTEYIDLHPTEEIDCKMNIT